MPVFFTRVLLSAIPRVQPDFVGWDWDVSVWHFLEDVKSKDAWGAGPMRVELPGNWVACHDNVDN